MKHRKLSRTLGAAAIAGAISFIFVVSAFAADKETVIYSFKGGNDEGFPYAGLVFDKAGNLYGTTAGGGLSDYYGTAFELSPTSNGGWKISVLHIFTGATDGASPYAGLVVDADGNLYGTTSAGGNLNYCNGLGCGTVFRLSPTSGGGWKETVLHAFTGGRDGGDPYAGVTFDAEGNLYGTTLKGGAAGECGELGCGVVFRLESSGNDWKETVLHIFGGSDGAYPYAGLTFGADGSLYGAASEGGEEVGTVFRLTPSSDSWRFSVLHRFSVQNDGGYTPRGRPVLDQAGNLYGTTSAGGEGGAGTVFRLSQTSSGGWKDTVIHSFTGNGGRYPLAGLILDSAGNLYGTTSYGGDVDGTVFELTPAANGKWQQTVLRALTGNGDGGAPYAEVIFDAAGNLYGTATAGGAQGWGCVFKLASTSKKK